MKSRNWEKWTAVTGALLVVGLSVVGCDDDVTSVEPGVVDAVTTEESGVADIASGETPVEDSISGEESTADTGSIDARVEQDVEEPTELIATDPPPGQLVTTVLKDGLTSPWAIDFLPDGRILLTERIGELHLFDPVDGSLSAPLAGVPAVWSQGQGGLLDVLVDPQFDENKTIYLSYSEQGNWDAAGSAVARATLGEQGLENVTRIFEQVPKVVGPNHFGSRMQFDTTGALMIGLGDRFAYLDDAQTLDNHMGKVVRILPDGTVPEDNPFVGVEGALPEIWSYGHRNIQGMAVHPISGEVFIHEHGPAGGDEVNKPQPGQNYGWPLACYGSHYDGRDIPDAHASEGFVEPLHYWTPSIAPSGMSFYGGDVFPHWRGNLFVGALAKRHLARLVMDGDTVTDEEQLLLERDERIRAVEEGPDGALYVLIDDNPNGKLIRLTWE